MKNCLKLSALALVLSLAATGCKKDEKAAPATTATTTEAPKATEPAKTEPAAADPAAAAPAAPAAAAPAGDVTFSSTEDYIAKAKPVSAKMIEVFKGAGTDCEKLATDLNKFVDDNAAFMSAAKAYEKKNPEAKKAFSAATKEQEKEFQASAEATMKACMNNKNVMAAVERIAAE